MSERAPISPYTQSGKEYESRIHDFRLANYLTVKELSEKTRLSVNEITALANGSKSPIYEITKNKGKVKPSVKKLCDFFKVGPEELFPRYICAVQLEDSLEEMEPWELYSERNSKSAEDVYAEQECAEFLFSKAMGLKHISTQAKKIFTYMFSNDCTLEEAATEFGVSRQAVHMSQTRIIERLQCSLTL